MKRFKSFIGSFLTLALVLATIPMAWAGPTMAEVDFVVRGADSIGVESAEVYVYLYDETTASYELYSGPHITADAAGRANNVQVPLGVKFFAVAYDSNQNVYADSNYSYDNIWIATDVDHIQNVDTGSTRLAYVHLYPGLYDAIVPTFPDTPTDPAPADPTPTDTTPTDPAPADPTPALVTEVGAAPSFEVQITVYDKFRNPIEGAQVYLYVTDFGIYSQDTTDGAGRTQEIIAPEGYEFYAIAYDADGVTYGGTYDYYYDRANYWSSSDSETIENVSTGLTRIPYLHLFPEELVPAGFVADSGDTTTFDPATYECGGFPDALYADITPEDCAAVEYVHDEGIFTGTGAGKLEWDRPINRAEVTKVILEAFDTPAVPTGVAPSKIFPDVPVTGVWFSEYVYRALHHAIVGGYPDGFFRPENTINRVELLRIFIEASGVDYSDTPTTYTFWHDITVDPEPQWFMGYANYAFFNDLLDNDGNLYPAEPMTRMDVMRLIYRASLLS